MAPGTDAFPSQKIAPPAFELTSPGQPLFYGSAGVGQAPINPPFSTIVAEDMSLGDNIRKAGYGTRGGAQPLVGGSAAVLGVIPPAVGSATVFKEDVDLYLEPPFPGATYPAGSAYSASGATIGKTGPTSAISYDQVLGEDPQSIVTRFDEPMPGMPLVGGSAIASTAPIPALGSGAVELQDPNVHSVTSEDPTGNRTEAQTDPVAPQKDALTQTQVQTAQRGEGGQITPGSLTAPVQYH